MNQVEAIATKRDLEEIKWTLIGETTATKRSKAIHTSHTRLSIETVSETFPTNPFTLQKTNPVIPPIGTCQELVTTAAKYTGIASSEKTRSETAMLTMKKLVVFFNYSRLNTMRIIRTFPTELKNKIME